MELSAKTHLLRSGIAQPRIQSLDLNPITAANPITSITKAALRKKNPLSPILSSFPPFLFPLLRPCSDSFHGLSPSPPDSSSRAPSPLALSVPSETVVSPPASFVSLLPPQTSTPTCSSSSMAMEIPPNRSLFPFLPVSLFLWFTHNCLMFLLALRVSLS